MHMAENGFAMEAVFPAKSIHDFRRRFSATSDLRLLRQSRNISGVQLRRRPKWLRAPAQHRSGLFYRMLHGKAQSCHGYVGQADHLITVIVMERPTRIF